MVDVAVTEKAERFGNAHRAMGWELAWLVASCCHGDSKGGRTKQTDSQESVDEMPGKVSQRQFADIAGVSRSTVNRYYKVWELAEADGQLANSASELAPDDEFPLDDEDIEALGNSWGYYYEWARTGKRPQDDQDEPEPEPEPSPRRAREAEFQTETDKSEKPAPKAKGRNVVADDDEITDADVTAFKHQRRHEAIVQLLEIVSTLDSKLEEIVGEDELEDADEETLEQIAKQAHMLSERARVILALRDRSAE